MSALCQFETFTLDAGLTGVGGGGPVFASNNEAPWGKPPFERISAHAPDSHLSPRQLYLGRVTR
jgi:hypothetical protein